MRIRKNNFFFLSLQLAYCRVARESATTANPIAEVARVANETWGEIHEALLRISGVSSDAELWNKAQEGFKSFSDGLQSSVTTLNEEVSLKCAQRNSIQLRWSVNWKWIFLWNHLDQTIARKGWRIGQSLHQQSIWSCKRIENQKPRIVQRRSS